MPVLTFSFFQVNDDGDPMGPLYRTFVFQDEPEFRHTGDYADLRGGELLQLLEATGLTENDAGNVLDTVLEMRVGHIYRLQRRLNDQQARAVRHFFPHGWW
jgi:hypothetical protein